MISFDNNSTRSIIWYDFHIMIEITMWCFMMYWYQSIMMKISKEWNYSTWWSIIWMISVPIKWYEIISLCESINEWWLCTIFDSISFIKWWIENKYNQEWYETHRIYLLSTNDHWNDWKHWNQNRFQQYWFVIVISMMKWSMMFL